MLYSVAVVQVAAAVPLVVFTSTAYVINLMQIIYKLLTESGEKNVTAVNDQAYK